MNSDSCAAIHRPHLADTQAIAVFMRRPPATIRWWASKGLLHRHGTGPRGRALYDLDEAEELLRSHPPRGLTHTPDLRQHRECSGRGVPGGC
jgi:hypothetical protein